MAAMCALDLSAVTEELSATMQEVANSAGVINRNTNSVNNEVNNIAEKLNATYIENAMESFNEKTDSLQEVMAEITSSINSITSAIEEGVKGVSGELKALRLLYTIWTISQREWVKMRRLQEISSRRPLFSRNCKSKKLFDI